MASICTTPRSLAAAQSRPLETFPPDYLIIHRDSALPEKLADIMQRKISDLPQGFEDYSLYGTTD